MMAPVASWASHRNVREQEAVMIELPRPDMARLGRLTVIAGLLLVVVSGGSLARACLPQPLISLQPKSSGPPGAEITVNARTINDRAEIRWNAPDGPLLGTATGPAFSVPITIPDVPRGLYTLVVIERQPDGGLGSSGTAAVAVIEPGDVPPGNSSSAAEPNVGSTTNLVSQDSAWSRTPLWLIAGLGLLVLAFIGGLLLPRPHRLPSPFSERRGE